MRRFIQNRIFSYLFYYIIGMGIVSLILVNWYRDNINDYVQEHMIDFNSQIDSYQSMQQKMMDNYYGLFLDDDQMGEVMSRAMNGDETTRRILRAQLMDKMYPVFESLKNYDTRIFFFHLPKQISFLRLHKPEKFGDSLTKQRPSVVKAQQTQKKVVTFETGKIFDGFRTIYPIFYQGGFVGTVEIAYPFLAIKNQAMKQMPGAYTFLIKRSLQESKAKSSDIEKAYNKSPFGERYYEDKESSLKQGMQGFASDEIDQIIDLNREKIQEALAQEKDQALVLMNRGKSSLMLLHSVKELNGQHAAYMVQITPDHEFFENEWHRLVTLLMTISVLYALLLWYVFRYNRSIIILEQYKKAMDENLIVSKTDEKGIITYVNERFIEISGYSENELIGKQHNIIRHPEMPSSVFKEMWTTVRNGKIWYGMIQNRKKTGESYYVNSTICPILDENGKIIEYIGLRENVTDLIESKMRAEELRKRAQKSEAAKMEFLANMSHEIRTPLNGIKGFAKLLQDAKLSTEHHRMATIIAEQSKALMGVINDILDLSKIESGKMELDPFEINTYFEFENAFALFIPIAREKGIDYAIRLDERLAESLVIDILRLKQVMTNLISNALKFTSDKGSVSVAIEVLEESEWSQKIAFSVSDTGIGINPEKLSTIFSPFTQEDSSTTRQFGGTGLGLSISSTLVKMFGGELKVESTKGEGSRFWFEIDIPKGSLSQQLSNRLQGKKIGLIDSGSNHCKIVKQQLSAFGITYDEYKALSETAGKDHFALIVFDSETARQLSMRYQETVEHIVLITSEPGIFGLERVIVIDAFERCPFRLYTTLYGLDGISKKNQDIVTWSGKRVLVADDYEVNRILMESLLETYGIEPDFAENGIIACEMAEQNRYDLVLMDINMPEMDGIDATRAIRQYNQTLPIVALTANALEGDRERFMGVGMNGYLSKPIVLGELEKILRLYLGEGTPVAPKPLQEVPLTQRLQNSLNLSEEVILKLLKLFDQSLPNYLEKLEEAIIGNDFEAIESHSHAIKGGSANLQLESIRICATKMEEKSKNKESEGLAELLEDLKQSCRAFHEEVAP